MLPKDWKSGTLGEYAKFLSKNTPSKDRPDYWLGNFPWVTAKDMKTLWLKNSGLGLTEMGKLQSSVAPRG